MKTDILFYRLFSEDPSLALRLAGLAELEGKDYRYISVELKEQSHRIDGVLMPSDGTLPVIIVEIQYWRDKHIYDRIVNETAVYRLQYPNTKRVQMLLFIPTQTMNVSAEIWQGLIESGALRVIILDEESALFDESREAASLLIQLTLTPNNVERDNALVQNLRTKISTLPSEHQRRLFRNLFVDLFQSKYKNFTRKEIEAMIVNMQHLQELKNDLREGVLVREIVEEETAQVAVQVAETTRTEDIRQLLLYGMTAEQISTALHVSLEKVEGIRERLSS
jgi:predicted transposase/invertase (TIGR01784 family)